MAKILVIDDDSRMCRTVGRILRRDGHEVVEARDGAKGLRAFRTDRPDIVVTDIVMPEKEGIETIIELRRECPSVPIVAMSGDQTGWEAYLRYAQILGADGTLAKPFRAKDLLREIDRLLRR